MVATLTLDPDVQQVCAGFTPSVSFAQFVQAIVTAEGNIIKAVNCSLKPEDQVTTRPQAIHIVCRSVVHRMSDYLKTSQAQTFAAYMGSFWAPIGAANDPTGLNKNWPGNVAKLWTGDSNGVTFG